MSKNAKNIMHLWIATQLQTEKENQIIHNKFIQYENHVCVRSEPLLTESVVSNVYYYFLQNFLSVLWKKK